MFVVSVGTMALIVVLSVFNGLEDLLKSLYNSFDPEIKIEATLGKSFQVSESLLQNIENVEGVEMVTEVIEDNAYVKYSNSEMVVQLKGVGDNFLDQNRIDRAMVQGDMILNENDLDYAIIGRGVQYNLGISIENDFYLLQVYYPKDVNRVSTDPEKMLNRKLLKVSGVFSIEKQYDEKYIFVPLEFARDLFEYGDRRTSLEVKVADGYSENQVQESLKSVLGEDFTVLNSIEQHQTLLRTIKYEKLVVFLIFTFILSVSSFNLFFSLSMLAIDKKKDIGILHAMGASKGLIQSIFFKEGAVISLSGAAIGLILGFLLVLAQEKVGIVSMGMQTAVVDYYPVKMKISDFIITAAGLITITLLASIRPALMAGKYKFSDSL